MSTLSWEVSTTMLQSGPCTLRDEEEEKVNGGGGGGGRYT